MSWHEHIGDRDVTTTLITPSESGLSLPSYGMVRVNVGAKNVWGWGSAHMGYTFVAEKTERPGKFKLVLINRYRTTEKSKRRLWEQTKVAYQAFSREDLKPQWP